MVEHAWGCEHCRLFFDAGGACPSCGDRLLDLSLPGEREYLDARALVRRMREVRTVTTLAIVGALTGSLALFGPLDHLVPDLLDCWYVRWAVFWLPVTVAACFLGVAAWRSFSRTAGRNARRDGYPG